MRSINFSGRRAVCALLLLVFSTTFAVWTSARTATTTAPATPPSADQQPVPVELWGEVTRDGKVINFTGDFAPRPGEVITWRVRLNNRRQTEIKNVRAVGPVPAGTYFVADSAEGEGVTVDYSLDGQNFSQRPMVKNGRGELVPADPSTYTSVRFTFSESVAPGTSKVASYRTRVR
jgi:uncharacterized repeat protein (TIGR01451 family)